MCNGLMLIRKLSAFLMGGAGGSRSDQLVFTWGNDKLWEGEIWADCVSAGYVYF